MSAKGKDVRAAAKAHTNLTDEQINKMPLSAVIEKLPIQIQKDLNLVQFGEDKMKRSRAYGGRAKKKMMGGGKVHKKMYAKGGGIRKAQTYG